MQQGAFVSSTQEETAYKEQLCMVVATNVADLTASWFHWAPSPPLAVANSTKDPGLHEARADIITATANKPNASLYNQIVPEYNVLHVKLVRDMRSSIVLCVEMLPRNGAHKA